MSCSTLYLLDKNMKIKKTEDFENSWLMCPNIWENLHNKHYKTDFNMFVATDQDFEDLEKELIEKGELDDLLLYYISCQQMIHLKDKDKIIHLLREFIIKQSLDKSFHSRILDLIISLVLADAEYFIWKATSNDDAVSSRFTKEGELNDKFKGEDIICELSDKGFEWLKWE